MEQTIDARRRIRGTVDGADPAPAPPNFGVGTESNILVAIAADRNGDGVYNDAPAVVPDADGDGVCSRRDLKEFGVVSNIAKARFFINP